MQGELIATEKDKTGATINIRYSNEFGGSPVVSVFFRGYSKLIDNGYAQPFIPVSNKQSKVIYAEIDGTIVGHVVFEIIEQPVKTAWVVFAGVEEQFRRRGIYKLLRLKHLEIIAKKLGCKKIASNVHVDNKIQLLASAQIGSVTTFYKTEKDI